MLTWMNRQEKRIALVLTLVFVLSIPSPSLAQQQREGWFINDWCRFSRSAETLAAMTAFGLGLIPPLQPVAIVYGAAAIGFKLYIMARCE
jgi:hypothetical protein